MVRPVADLYARVRHHGPELVKFGIVGGIGTIIDLGGAAVLHSVYHLGPLESKAISLTAATVFTYLGSRFWTFRHRENQPVHREAMLFIVLNLVGLVLAEVVIACVTYGLGLKGPVAYNVASIIGTGLGTVFRWYAYRKWVFLAPAQQPTAPYAPWEPYPAYPDPAYPDHSYPAYAYQAYPAAPGPAYPSYPDPGYPHPAYPAGHSRLARLEDPFIPNGRVASPLVATAAPAGPAFHPFRPAAAPAPAPVPAPDPGAHRAPGRHRRTR
jgi:putative flippase GtrA